MKKRTFCLTILLGLFYLTAVTTQALPRAEEGRAVVMTTDTVVATEDMTQAQLLAVAEDKEVAAAEAQKSEFAFTEAELDLLARLVHAEAAGEPYQGQVAVAATVLNRLRSERFPDTLHGIIYQVESGRYQYSPVLDGRINLPAGESAKKAVAEALAGTDPTGGATGFYNPAKTGNAWVRRHPVTAVIGSHVFFYY